MLLYERLVPDELAPDLVAAVIKSASTFAELKPLEVVL
jgi:hypothetical protein